MFAPRRIGWVVGLMALVPWGCGPHQPIESGSGEPATSALREDQRLVLGELATGESRLEVPASFFVDLKSGEAVRLTVQQRGVDLQVKILDLAGTAVGGFDGPYGTEAAEQICFMAPHSGRYRIRLEPFGEASGHFDILLQQRRSATLRDRRCAAAQKRFMAAEARRLDGGISGELAAEYEQAHRDWALAGERFLATVALRQAGIVWRQLGRSSEAEERYREAQIWASATGDPFLEISLANDLGQVFRDRRDFTMAREAFQAALDRAREVGNPRLQALSLNNLALVEERMGRFHRALDHLRQAAAKVDRFERDLEYVQIRINLARIYTVLDNYDEALEMLEEAAAEALLAGDRRRRAAALTNMGWLHYLRGQPQRGAPILNQALELYRQQGDQRWQLGVLDRLGTVLAAAGHGSKALDAYLGSLAISTEFDYVAEAALTRANLGCLYPQLGRLTDGLAALAEARPVLEAGDDPSAISFLEFCQAAAERKGGDLDAALRSIARARELVEDLHGIARQQGARFQPIPLWQDFAELHLHLLMAKARSASNPELEVGALETIDLARSRSLFELVLESRIGVRSAAGPALLEREREVQAKLNAAAVRGADETSRGRRLGELTLELERVRAAIRASDPRYSRMVAPIPLDLKTVRARLPDGAVLLRYVLTNETSYLFVIGATHWAVHDLAPAWQLEPQIQRYYQRLRQSFLDPVPFDLSARLLSQALLPPGALPAGTRQLLVVADGSLHYLPFATLGAPLGDDDTALLLDQLEIQYLPSAALLGSGFEEPRKLDSAAVFADAVFSLQDERFAGEVNDACGSELRSIGIERLPEGDLPRLPCTRSEAERLVQLVGGGRSFAALGFKATKEVVLTEPLDRYAILHFATHAFIDERFPELSGLVLSRVDSHQQLLDGDLHLHEIYGLHLNAELVTLSGCQTALGRQARGNGLLSMARGFLYAGCSRVLVSLWSVNDEATAELMGRFYQALLSEGQPPARALQTAQLWMRRQPRWRAPYYWAAFVLQGGP